MKTIKNTHKSYHHDGNCLANEIWHYFPDFASRMPNYFTSIEGIDAINYGWEDGDFEFFNPAPIFEPALIDVFINHGFDVEDDICEYIRNFPERFPILLDLSGNSNRMIKLKAYVEDEDEEW